MNICEAPGVTLIDEPNRLQQAYQQCPGLQAFCHSLWANFSPRWAFKHLEPRAAELLGAVPEKVLSEQLEGWKQLGVVPEPDPARMELVGYLWQSPLFQALLQAIGFWPPADTDLRRFIPTPYQSLAQMVMAQMDWRGRCQRGGIARGTEVYWQGVLRLQAPSLYLEPFLDGQRPLRGCDLACGWGRISLALPSYVGRTIEACDLSQDSLTRLQQLAANRQLGPETVRTHRCDILQLPFASDEFDFLLAFDIFEHLTDELVHAALTEALRVARVGAVIYTEIPLHAYCPALTHVQNFDQPAVLERFAQVRVGEKRWQPLLWSEFMPDHFAFKVIA